MSSQYDFCGFLMWLCETRCALETARAYSSAVADFARWFEETNGERFEPGLVTPMDLREYQEYLVMVRNLKPGTVNRRAATLRKFFVWAKERGLVSDLPWFPKPVREQPRAPRSLSRVEQNRLLRVLERSGNVRDIAIVRLLLSTGLRLGELVSLKITDLKLGERHGKVTVRRGKGMKFREVPLPVEARRVLRKWLDVHPGSEYLFPGRNGEVLSSRAVQKLIKKYAYQAGLDMNSVHPHVLRHTCATNMLKAGANLVEVAAVLGHESLDTTAIYTQPRLSDLAKAAERGEVS